MPGSQQAGFAARSGTWLVKGHGWRNEARTKNSTPPLSRGQTFAAGLRGRLRVSRMRIRMTDALASVVPGWRIGRGRNSVGAAVAHATVHALAAFLAPALFTMVRQSSSFCRC